MNIPKDYEGNIYASEGVLQKNQGILFIDETGIRFRISNSSSVVDIPFASMKEVKIVGLLSHRISIVTGNGTYILKARPLERWKTLIILGMKVTRKLSHGSGKQQSVQKGPSNTATRISTHNSQQSSLVQQIQTRKSRAQQTSPPISSGPTPTPPIIQKKEYAGSWPTGQDYEQSFQAPGSYIHPSLGDTQKWTVEKNAKNVAWLVQASGNYGSIYKVKDQDGKCFALKCFTRKSSQLNERYQVIHNYLDTLKGNGLPLMDFSYFPDGIRTRRDPKYYFPMVRMPWIEGLTLNKYISKNLTHPKAIENTATSFLEGVSRLQESGIAHGDLSGDNIIVDPHGKVILVDYDGMFVPPLKGYSATENGHADFQHPMRTKSTFSRYMDNFSIAVVYLSLLAISKRPELWEKYNQDDPDCLIMRKADFLSPSSSAVFGDLSKIRSPRTKKLRAIILQAIKEDPEWSGTSAKNISSI